MASKITTTILVLTALFAAVFLEGALAQSSGCSSAIVSLAPCLNYISGNSSSPSSSCCSQLASVVGSEPQCLCQVLNGNAASSLGITVNQTLALQLPKACNVNTPAASSCNGPTGSPPSTTTPSGSKNVPSTSTTTTTTSDGSNFKMQFSLLFFLIFLGLRASSIIGF